MLPHLHSYPAKLQVTHLLRPAIYLHITVCAGAAFLAVQTTYRLGLKNTGWDFYCFLALATYLSYNLHFLLAGRLQQSSRQLQWFKHHQKKITLSFLLPLFLLPFLWTPYSTSSEVLLVLIALNALYTLPLLLPATKLLLPAITFLKPYYIGCCWSLVTVALPVYIDKKTIDHTAILELAYTLLLVTLATMLFDWRDRQADQQAGIHTSANLFSRDHFTRFFTYHLVLFFFIALAIAIPQGIAAVASQLLLCAGIAYLLYTALQSDSEVLYLVWVDGLLVITPILTVLFF